ncbi:ABC transporter permease subunit [Streptomyces pinistramenti]|uniref:ABC transporter permease subunit n=1 Tax=Streptomyces pinistramenti TaxID=2884812 RepID=UPI001D096C22|nr:ABC transporter permease subunit [Streptomyces pinistramenti]MCB5907657.1 ABC transporter permease [Streptomyces pinistramenti]
MSGTTQAASPSRTERAVAPDGGSAASGARRELLHKLPWLVWRRHRAALRLGLLITVVACAVFAYQRMGIMDFLGGRSAPDLDGQQAEEFQNRFNSTFKFDLAFLTFLPGIVGVFLGAPLIAGEQEHGTLKLVTTQSASRARWITATLVLPLAVVVVCTTLLSVVFHWMWAPAHEIAAFGDWLDSGIFESTGPVLPARTLLFTVCGIAIGMLAKRVVTAMAVTAVFAAVFSVIWAAKVRHQLGTLRDSVYPYDGDGPDLPPGSIRIDDWLSTAGGDLFGISTCNDDETGACRAKLGIVNRVTQYFDYGQMTGMQWLGAGILLALTVAALAFVIWRARRRPL